VEARITVHTPELAAVTPIAGLALAHVTVQPMPGGTFLVAGARCRWRRDGPDRNGVLYDAGGQVVCESVLGDGIGHVLATSDGQVWVGYFDEGIYGNYGWGQADTEEPVGASGIVRFSPGLAPAWHYPDIPRSARGMQSVTAVPSTWTTSAPGPAMTPISRSCASATAP
jgi:hypothetical protein